MPIDSKKYGATPTRGNVASTALKTSVALDSILIILDQIIPKIASQLSKDEIQTIQSEIAEIKLSSKGLEEQFDELTGWTPSE